MFDPIQQLSYDEWSAMDVLHQRATVKQWFREAFVPQKMPKLAGWLPTSLVWILMEAAPVKETLVTLWLYLMVFEVDMQLHAPFITVVEDELLVDVFFPPSLREAKGNPLYPTSFDRHTLYCYLQHAMGLVKVEAHQESYTQLVLDKLTLVLRAFESEMPKTLVAYDFRPKVDPFAQIAVVPSILPELSESLGFWWQLQYPLMVSAANVHREATLLWFEALLKCRKQLPQRVHRAWLDAPLQKLQTTVCVELPALRTASLHLWQWFLWWAMVYLPRWCDFGDVMACVEQYTRGYLSHVLVLMLEQLYRWSNAEFAKQADVIRRWVNRVLLTRWVKQYPSVRQWTNTRVAEWQTIYYIWKR